ncbi:MAG: hypothetical protein AB7R77_25510, partial [Ilumatobacteraceae bacterium]
MLLRLRSARRWTVVAAATLALTPCAVAADAAPLRIEAQLTITDVQGDASFNQSHLASPRGDVLSASLDAAADGSTTARVEVVSYVD